MAADFEWRPGSGGSQETPPWDKQRAKFPSINHRTAELFNPESPLLFRGETASLFRSEICRGGHRGTSGKIKLDISNAQPAALMDLTLLLRDGLTGNTYYAALHPTLAALGASYTAQRTMSDTIATLEQQSKSARATQLADSVTVREVLRQAARECESANNTDEALVSAGWTLRKIPGPPQMLPAPTGLTLKPTGYPGKMFARWSRVPNFRFHKIQVAVPADPTAAPGWSDVPVRSTTVSSDTLPIASIGLRMYYRVRTVSAKGPSPWSQEAAAIVL